MNNIHYLRRYDEESIKFVVIEILFAWVCCKI